LKPYYLCLNVKLQSKWYGFKHGAYIIGLVNYDYHRGSTLVRRVFSKWITLENKEGGIYYSLRFMHMMWNNCCSFAPKLLRFFIDLICLPTIWKSSLALVEMMIGIHFAKPLDITKDYHKDAFLTLGKDWNSQSCKRFWIQPTKKTRWFLKWDIIFYLSCWRIVKTRKDSREMTWYLAIVHMA